MGKFTPLDFEKYAALARQAAAEGCVVAAAAGAVDGLVCVLEDVVCAVVAQSGAVIRVAASVIVFIISIL